MYLQDMVSLDHIGSICLGQNARMAARAVTRVLDARLRPLDLRITQFTILVAIATNDDLSIAAMAKLLDIEPSTLTRNVTLLKTRRLIKRNTTRGRSGQRLALTKSGREMLDKAVPLWAKAHRELVAALDSTAKETRAALRNLEAAALTLERGDNE